jgi:hypothetical protein
MGMDGVMNPKEGGLRETRALLIEIALYLLLVVGYGVMRVKSAIPLAHDSWLQTYLFDGLVNPSYGAGERAVSKPASLIFLLVLTFGGLASSFILACGAGGVSLAQKNVSIACLTCIALLLIQPWIFIVSWLVPLAALAVVPVCLASVGIVLIKEVRHICFKRQGILGAVLVAARFALCLILLQILGDSIFFLWFG